MERKRGRSFNESDDDETFHEMNILKKLLEKFSKIEEVLENAAMTAAFMHYIFNKSQEYFSMLYFYTIQKYLRINETKNSMRNYNHINMEIYTTFIHPKSVLQINLKSDELIKKIEDNIDSEDCLLYFSKVSESIVSDVLCKFLEQFREFIRLGLESFAYINKIHENLSRVNELSILNGQHKLIQNQFIRNQKSRCLPSQNQDIRSLQIFSDFQVQALVKALNTQYEYFIFSKKYSYIMKNPDIVIPIKTFLTRKQVKLLDKQRIKGHCFEEDTLSRIAFCFVCDIILWGSHPNCLYCKNCKKAVHKDCKDFVKYCQIDSKRSKTNENVENEEGKIKKLDGKMTKDLINIIDGNKIEIISEHEPDSETNPFSEPVPQAEDDEMKALKCKEKPKLPTKPSILKLQEWKSQYSSSFNNDKTKKINLKYTTSMTANHEKKVSLDSITRSKSARSPSPQNQFKKETYKFHMRSSSEDSGLAVSVEPLSKNFDDEMRVLETFEPEFELLRFSNPSIRSSFNNEGDYKRLLVLLEFHHKTRFTRMTLKRFKLLLVDPWQRMSEYLELFESLSLPCIDKLYKLIGSLVDVIDYCKGEDTYDSTIAEKILNWLSEDDDRNLQNWLHLSIDLCCTNILQAVKANWMEHKQMSTKLNDLFSIEINRILVIEQLSSMKPLLFNLPMIVTKIVKDLKNFPHFQDESKIWEQVGMKLSYLPQLIDERCMPLVHLINNGTISSSSLKYKRYKNKKEHSNEMEIYINNFPKTIFKNNFIDFQFIRISNLRETYFGEPKSIQSVVYVREEVDAAIICYDNEMIILQKENDKYLLKQFKSFGTHKLFPMIPFYKIHVTKQIIKKYTQFQHELTVLVISEALLLKILFKEEKARDMWYEHITKRAKGVHKESNIEYQSSANSSSTISTNNFDFSEAHELVEFDRTTSKMLQIRNSLNDSIHHFASSLDFITNELSQDENPDEHLTRIKNEGTNSSCEFLYVYLNILKEYFSLGAQMLEDSDFFKKDVLKLKLPKLRGVTEEMMSLICAEEKIDVESKSSGQNTVENDHLNGENSEDIHRYIENIIVEALNKIQYNKQ